MKLQRKLSNVEMRKEIEDNKALYKQLYITKNMTARKVAENQNISVSEKNDANNWAKNLHKILPKGMGLGGSRIGSGNKKGWNKQPK